MDSVAPFVFMTRRTTENMQVYTAFDLFHTVPPRCDPDLPIPMDGPKKRTRAELEERDYDPCEVCFPSGE